MSPGIDVLNIGAGHLKFRFDKEDKEETAKAKKVLTDMLGRGYMLFCIVDGEQKRVRKFDPKTEEYILEEPEVMQSAETVQSPEPAHKVSKITGKRDKRCGYRRVPMRSTRATGIAPTAGG